MTKTQKWVINKLIEKFWNIRREYSKHMPKEIVDNFQIEMEDVILDLAVNMVPSIIPFPSSEECYINHLKKFKEEHPELHGETDWAKISKSFSDSIEDAIDKEFAKTESEEIKALLDLVDSVDESSEEEKQLSLFDIMQDAEDRSFYEKQLKKC